jgi:hypothetical protein
MEIKTLKNGMVIFDDGSHLLQVLKTDVRSVNIFPPEYLSGRGYDPTNELGWRVVVSSPGGYISFSATSREDCDDILSKINEALLEETP